MPADTAKSADAKSMLKVAIFEFIALNDRQ
jgi:hypothetical protein